MDALALQTMTESGGHVAQIARTFGVDWPHLASQLVSFSFVCAVLYAFAYKPILRMLEARRQQIAAGIAHAEEITTRLAQIEAERQQLLAKADAEGRQLLEQVRAAAARTAAEETAKAAAAAEQILMRAREAAAWERARLLADLKREVGRLVVETTATVTGKVLSAEDHRRLAEETVRQLAA